jgi:hypothetical protein
MDLIRKLRTAERLMKERGYQSLGSWVQEAREALVEERQSHERICSTIEIHHRNFDQIYERAAQEAKRPSSLSHKAFAEWIMSITHPEAPMR